MKAIVTKYIGPTNHKGARISVKAEGLPRMFVSWNDALHINANHTEAAKRLAAKYNWSGAWFGGGMPDQTGNCYVRAPMDAEQLIGSRVWIDPEDSFYIEREE